MTMRVTWGGRVASDGAPFVIADVSQFEHWRGAGGSLVPGFHFRVRGRLAPALRLPTERSFATRADAIAAAHVAVSRLRDLSPEVHQLVGPQRRSIESWVEGLETCDSEFRFADAQGPCLVGTFAPADSDFLRIATTVTTASIVGFARAAIALWRPGSGTVAEVGVGDDGLLLLIAYAPSDPAELRQLRATVGKAEGTACGTLDVAEDVLVIADSVFGSPDLVVEGAFNESGALLRAASRLRGPVRLNTSATLGSATVVRVRPGRYLVSTGELEGATPEPRWCKIVHKG